MLAKKSETSRKVTVTEHYVTRALLKAESYTKTSPVCSQSKGVTTTTSTMHQTRLTNILIYDGNGDNLTRSPQPPPQTSATFRELFATFGKTTTKHARKNMKTGSTNDATSDLAERQHHQTKTLGFMLF